MSVESFKCKYMKDGEDLTPPKLFFVLCEYHDKPYGRLLSILREMNDFCSKCEVFLEESSKMREINKLKMENSILKDKNEQLRKTVGTWQSRSNKFKQYLSELGYEVEVDLIEHGYEP